MTSSGSQWRRWDPHIHSPGTTFEDRFGGDDSWDEYIDRLKSASPSIEALGVTDYFRLDGYKKVRDRWEAGELEGIKFVFPNIELRYGIGSPKGSPINFHLLVSPEDPEHIDNIERFLGSLTFKAGPNHQTFRCNTSDIQRLGRMHKDDPKLDDAAAFREGANQFKVSPDEFLKEAHAEWANQISSWLYDTRHISVSYGLQYEGIEIETLSPGTRGIVLLLLYLAIDTDDDRPLLVDQPEENLDPKSIYDELVDLFRAAKLRRQIIIVTHNANLVVNTDADQVIIADCGTLKSGALPDISYRCGSLENETIRQEVCSILEGGEDAFKDRAKRLRING